LVANSADIDDNGQDDESGTAHDFNCAKNEFDYNAQQLSLSGEI